jgi:TonB family protein
MLKGKAAQFAALGIFLFFIVCQSRTAEPAISLTLNPITSQNSQDALGRKIINSADPDFPQVARKSRLLNPVRLRLQVDEGGNVVDVVLLEGHPLLNDLAIRAVKKWKYKPELLNGMAVPFLTTVTVNFSHSGMPKMDVHVARLLSRMNAGKPANPEEGQFVIDGRAQLALALAEDGARMISRVISMGFEVTSWPQGSNIVSGRMAINKIDELLNLGFIASISAIQRPMRGGNVKESKIITRVEPAVPVHASKAGIHGPVKVEIWIDEYGDVSDARILQGHVLLNGAAIKALGQWRYTPTILNGIPIPVITHVTFKF